jgi:hypothetical protein
MLKKILLLSALLSIGFQINGMDQRSSKTTPVPTYNRFSLLSQDDSGDEQQPKTRTKIIHSFFDMPVNNENESSSSDEEQDTDNNNTPVIQNDVQAFGVLSELLSLPPTGITFETKLGNVKEYCKWIPKGNPRNLFKERAIDKLRDSSLETLEWGTTEQEKSTIKQKLSKAFAAINARLKFNNAQRLRFDEIVSVAGSSSTHARFLGSRAGQAIIMSAIVIPLTVVIAYTLFTTSNNNEDTEDTSSDF